jgi:DNA-binding LacI/PurR family transcriptional regulator
VVGFDGVRLDGLADDDLTTMVQPATEKGLAAARVALAMVETGEPQAVAFESRFHRGATTAPPVR